MAHIQKANPSTDKCDLCGDDLKRFDHYFDVLHKGPDYPRAIWGWLCGLCIAMGYAHMGTIYNSKTDEKIGRLRK